MAASALAGLVMAAIIVVPQIIVAVAAPWVGHYAEQWGRKPMLLARFGLEPLRGVLFALGASWYSIIAVQILDGITGAIITVMIVSVMTDHRNRQIQPRAGCRRHVHRRRCGREHHRHKRNPSLGSADPPAF